MRKLVSIIMPSFNTAQHISCAIQSVLDQTYKSFELIIVDDGSTDHSKEIIQSFDDTRIVFIALEKNQGPQYVRNLALSKAKGEYIAFLDSDDFWEKDKLEKQIDFMEKTNTPLSYTPYFTIRENMSARGGGYYPRQELSYKDLLLSCDIGNSTAIYDAKLLGKVENGKLRHDYELWLKILKKGHIARCAFDKPLATIRLRSRSDTANKIKSAILQWRVYREVEKFSWLRSIYYQLHYAFYGFKKHLIYRK